MKILNIAVFMFIFNLSLGVFSAIYGVATPGVNSNITYTDFNQTSMNMSSSQFLAWTWNSLVYAWESFKTILTSAFAIGFFLQHLFPIIPTEYAALLTAVVDLLYALAIIQFFTGRNLKEFQ
ncbi:MAG: hypothetical protein DRJ64_04645 [Thermoprotei archaeon]|nr:MAG: hypothetical protein DRJ64_04645 [Thermoprotei archaeon]